MDLIIAVVIVFLIAGTDEAKIQTPKWNRTIILEYLILKILARILAVVLIFAVAGLMYALLNAEK